MHELLEHCFNLSQHYIFRECGHIIGEKNFKKTWHFSRYFSPQHQGWGNARLVILVGPRGIGKTVTLLQDISTHSRALYLPMDDYTLRGWKDASLYTIGKEYVSYGGNYLLIDEIHKYQNWAQELKSLYDHFPKLKIVVSGSSLLEITKASYDLSRRAVIKRVFGMSFREFLLLKYGQKKEIKTYLNYILAKTLNWETFIQESRAEIEKLIQFLEKHNIFLLPEFEQYCKTGYYPYFNEFKNEETFRKTLQQQVDATIEADIPNCFPNFTGASTKKVGQLLAFLAQSVPYTPNYRELKQALGIGDERTLKEYLHILEKAQLIKAINKHHKGFQEVTEPGKFMLFNTNLSWALSHEPNKGTQRETFVASMLSILEEEKRIKLSLPDHGDFRVQHNQKVYTLEVGSPNKSFRQIKDSPTPLVVRDGLRATRSNEIPLWYFGFLY